jgi:hypothetical protein
MRSSKVRWLVSMFALACSGKAMAQPATPEPTAAPPPPPQASPPPPPQGAPPPVEPARPSDAASPPAAPPPGPPGARYRRRPPAQAANEIRFEPEPRDTTLLILQQEMPVYRFGYYGYGYWGPRRDIARAYAPVCTGPCSARFAPGAYELALAKGGHIARSPGRVMIMQPSTVKGEYLDRSGVRLAGVLIGVGGIVGGTIMMILAVHRDDICDVDGCYYHQDVDGPLLAGGIALAIGGAIAGSIMAWQRDEAVFTILPLRVSSLLPGAEGSVAKRALPEGAMVSMRF